ncbi:hypothetical protein BZG36_03863, partial [Bifiguratus adelaidae]
MYRDRGQWDRLGSPFLEDGTIDLTGFKGKASDFVDGSAKMGASDFRTQHVISPSLVEFQGNRAIAGTNCIIIGENVRLKLGTTAHARMYGLIERRNNVWKLFERHRIYDMATFNFPSTIPEIEGKAVEKHPREYATIAYLLE